MARRPNYGAEKRAKELGKQRKKEEKEEKKRARREAGLPETEVTEDGELDVAALRPDGAADEADGDDRGE
ncbi:MAG TPA: hypothetical protein VFJ82_13475 [Longimicrobium sp.]|nr:hypothetical protein [Longimicrobium sp.]